MRIRDQIVLSYFGLTEREAAVLRSMLNLVPELSEKFQLVPPEHASTSDIVIVNADSRAALSWWRECQSKNVLAVPLMLSKHELPNSQIISIRRPIQLRAFQDALARILKYYRTETVDTSDTSRSARVLVVDDSYSVRQYMGHTLQKLIPAAIDVQFAESGEECMELLWAEHFDIVFLDVVMPGMDGYKVCKAIKDEKFAFVVMLTSKRSPFDKVRGTMSGCDAYLTKPPQESELREILGYILDEKQTGQKSKWTAAGQPDGAPTQLDAAPVTR